MSDQAGDAGADGGGGEATIRLQQSVQHDREAVEQGLRGEDGQDVAGGGHHLGPSAVDVGVDRGEQRGDPPRSDGDHHHERHQDDHRPRQQRRGDGADPGLLGRVAVCSLGGAGQDRDHGAGERTAQDQLVEQVRDLVGGDVRPAEAGSTDGLGEDQRADQAQQPRQYGEPGHDGGATGDARTESGRETWLLRLHLYSAFAFVDQHVRLPIPAGEATAVSRHWQAGA